MCHNVAVLHVKGVKGNTLPGVWGVPQYSTFLKISSESAPGGIPMLGEHNEHKQLDAASEAQPGVHA
jgi:hypothetical protein